MIDYISKSKKINSIIQEGKTLIHRDENSQQIITAYRTYVERYDPEDGTWKPELCIAINRTGLPVLEYIPEYAEECIRKYADLRKWVVES